MINPGTFYTVYHLVTYNNGAADSLSSIDYLPVNQTLFEARTEAGNAAEGLREVIDREHTKDGVIKSWVTMVLFNCQSDLYPVSIRSSFNDNEANRKLLDLVFSNKPLPDLLKCMALEYAYYQNMALLNGLEVIAIAEEGISSVTVLPML